MSIAREMRALGIAGSFLNVTEDGKVTEATRQCLEIIAKHDMVLATSHIRPSEVLPVVKAAQEVGRAAHRHHPSRVPDHAAEHRPAAGAGQARRVLRALLHHAQYRQDHAGSRSTPTSARSVPDSTILATDLGQSTAPYPDEGLGMLAERLLDNGFAESDVRRMVRDNPRSCSARATTARRRQQRCAD